MEASIPALVEPSLLRWARESIGLDALAASGRLGLPDDRVFLAPLVFRLAFYGVWHVVGGAIGF
jgi:hypothetical protein